MSKRPVNPSSPTTEPILSKAAEEALFQRLLRRLGEAGHTAVAGAEAVAGTAQDAASLVRDAAVRQMNLMLHSVTPATLTATTHYSRLIVERRKKVDADIVQVLFRLPAVLRDEIKRISIDEKRQMDELLTEAVLDLLIKHGRPPEILGEPYETLKQE